MSFKKRLAPAGLVPTCAPPTCLDAAFNLTWISKNIRFENHTIEPAMGADPFDLVTIDALLEGGMPTDTPNTSKLNRVSQLRRGVFDARAFRRAAARTRHPPASWSKPF
jgi:hypothetical protein